MERSKVWHIAFKTNLGLLERNLEGLTDDLAVRQPGPGANSPAWLLAHVYGARKGMLRLAGCPQPVEADLDPKAGRGGDGKAPSVPFSELVRRFRATDPIMKACFLAVDDWDQMVKNPGLGVEQPLEQVIAFMYMHESYHLGQIGLARKMLGLPGAVA
ncbi:MAG: DinB family protein [Acidobacteria bacterium]|nr:DinB family protein [Acidobacteriota bacterium]